MTIQEVRGNLFTVTQGHYLAHCISGDYALGAGIAEQFNAHYDMRYKLHKFYPIPDGEKYANVGRALLVDNVFNLVTKNRCFQKPTYETLYDTLCDMRDQCVELSVRKLAIPKIGCGLDKLNWEIVKENIEAAFDDVPIDIVVCLM